MRPFDLEAAKRGEAVCTKDGRFVRMLCFDVEGEYPIVGVVPHMYHKDMTLAHSYRKDGSLAGESEDGIGALMMIYDEPVPVPEPVADKEVDEYMVGDDAGNLLIDLYHSLPEAVEAAKSHANKKNEMTFVLRPVKRISKQVIVEDWDKI